MSGIICSYLLTKGSTAIRFELSCERPERDTVPVDMDWTSARCSHSTTYSLLSARSESEQKQVWDTRHADEL